MLKIHRYSTDQGPFAFFEERVLKGGGLEELSFVVSDLKTKQEIQKQVLSKQALCSDELVLRASELWRGLLLRLSPQTRVISSDLARSLIADWLAESELTWAKRPGAAQVAFNFIQQLLPVFAHPQGDEWIGAWLNERPDSLIRWSHWYELSRQIWQRFQEEYLMASPWVAGYLLSQAGLDGVKSKELIFSLGAELTGVEAELLSSLAKGSDVTVLVPEADWLKDYEGSLLAYAQLCPEIFSRLVAQRSSSNKKVSLADCRRYSSRLSEVKAATAQVRQWLDQGVAPNKVAIVAPDIEAYWTCLREYLQSEAIPVDKAVVSSQQATLAHQVWLAQMRLASGQLQSSDLVMGVLPRQSDERGQISFERFCQLFRRIYDREDLLRDKSLGSLYRRTLTSGQRLVREEFVAWALQQWPEWADEESLLRSLSALYQECPEHLNLRLNTWVQHIQKIQASQETEVAAAQKPGVHCVSLHSAGWLNVSHLWLMGLSEDALRTSNTQGLTLADTLSLSAAFGLSLSQPDQARLEFEARCLLDRSWVEVVASVADTDFMGQVLAPSLLWLEARQSRNPSHGHQLNIPGLTRWDEWQRQDPEKIWQQRSWSEHQQQVALEALEQDWGHRGLGGFGVELRPRLSVSKLEAYLRCPFIFAAEKLLRLSSLAEIDLDVDAATRGQLMHSLFEKIVGRGGGQIRRLTESEMEDLLEECRREKQMVFADERLWRALKARYRDLGRRFIESEEQWRKSYPLTKTVDTEVRLTGAWCLKNGQLVESGQGDLPFIGFVDRIDSDGSSYALIDYKSSAPSAAQISSWLENDSLQMSLYAQAIERGLSELPIRPVVGAFYYVAKNLDRSKGYRLTDVEQELYSSDGRDKGRVTKEQRDKVFEVINERVQEAVASIHRGEFTPRPKKETECLKCDWRSLCRAPHLN